MIDKESVSILIAKELNKNKEYLKLREKSIQLFNDLTICNSKECLLFEYEETVSQMHIIAEMTSFKLGLIISTDIHLTAANLSRDANEYYRQQVIARNECLRIKEIKQS